MLAAHGCDTHRWRMYGSVGREIAFEATPVRHGTRPKRGGSVPGHKDTVLLHEVRVDGERDPIEHLWIDLNAHLRKAVVLGRPLRLRGKVKLYRRADGTASFGVKAVRCHREQRLVGRPSLPVSLLPPSHTVQ